MLIKLHKKDLDIRPIINSISHQTERISNLIDLILKPIIKSIHNIYYKYVTILFYQKKTTCIHLILLY
jgi:hypothetical protein